MPPAIQAFGPIGATFTFNLVVRDWNGDEWPLTGATATLAGIDASTITISQDPIGAENVGIVTVSIVNSGGDYREAANLVITDGELVFVAASVELFSGSSIMMLSNGASLANGGTVTMNLGRRVSPSYAPSGRIRANVTGISLFQSGHGFALYTSGGASPFSNLNETASPVYGTQHAWAGSAGGVSAGFAGIQRIGGTAIDMTGKTFRMTFKIVNKANLQELGIFLGTASLANYCRIYAHSNQSQWVYREGEVVTLDYPLGTRTFAAAADYSVTGSPAMNAITDIRVRVQDGQLGANQGSVEIHLYELAIVATQSRGKILIMFDDEDATVFTEGFWRMKQRGMVGHNYLIRDKIDTSGKMTTAQLDLLHLEGWDNCCHAATDFVHDSRIVTLPERVVEADFIAIKEYVNSRGYRGANYYATPGGDFDNGTVSRYDLIRKYFRTHRTINTRQSETQPMADPHKMRTIYVTSSTSAQLVKDRLDACMLDSKGIAEWYFTGSFQARQRLIQSTRYQTLRAFSTTLSPRATT